MTEMTSKTTARAAARTLLAAILALAACAALAPSAFAAPTGRTFVEQVGFTQPEEVYVTPTEKLLISDVSKGEMLEYSLAPGIQKTGLMASQGFWGGSTQVHSIAESAVNNYRYVATDGEELVSGGACGGTPFTIFDNYGAKFKSEREDFICAAYVTVDNAPQSENYGHYFFYGDEGGIEQFDGYGNPANFSGTASYIEGNKLTGTPFSEGLHNGGGQPSGAGITVDEDGNIWLINNNYPEHEEILEYAPSGEFLQRITEGSSGAPEVTNGAGTHPMGYYPGLGAIAIDPTNGDVVVSDKAADILDEFTPQGKYIGAITGAETPQGSFKEICRSPEFCFNHVDGLAFDKNGYLYVADGFGGKVDVFSPRPKQPAIEYKPDTNPTSTSGTLNAVVDPAGGGEITSCKFEFGATNGYGTTIPCTPDPSGSHFANPTEVHADVSGLTAETTYHYRVTVGSANATRVGPDRTFTPHKVLGLRTEEATVLSSSGATLNGSFVGDGSHTTYWFEYGTTTAYGSKVPAPAPPGGDAGSPAGPGRTQLSTNLTGLKPVTRYHFRVVAENGNLSRGQDLTFNTSPLLPQVSKENVTSVHSDQLDLNAQISPGGADTTYEFEFGTEPCSNEPDPCATPFLVRHVGGSNLSFFPVSQHVEGLQPGVTYYYRVKATNSEGTKYGPDRRFSTYRFLAELKDACPNALARQQTGAALVTDCRGYELVSSASAGGYDVESTLVSSQTPFEGYPRAESPLRVLYGIHSGAIPGIEGEPTNRGVDPYVATRGEDGWTTSYVGIPANNPFAKAPFSSTLSEADQALDSFAFAGPEVCSPCFEDGTSGVPLHRADGRLEQGMRGSIEPASPASEDGRVGQRFSGDGTHFVFASTSQFAEGGNDSTGDVSIYDRNLDTNQTQVVSTDENGDPLSCLQGAGSCHGPGDAAGISELAISQDGSRILVGQKVSTDSAGNDYYRLYMHEGESADSIPLTSGATDGVLFDGMTADGSHVFFTTADALGGGDADTSADIYEAAIENGASSLRLLSTEGGSASNDDSCAAVGTPSTWNAVSGDGKCDAVAFAGGAGVASESGDFYFMSPELLDAAAEAEGEEGEVNLYLVKQGGDPEFGALLDSSAPKAPPAPPKYTAGAHHTLLTGLHGASSIAVNQNQRPADPTGGDIYVAEAGGGGNITRWKPDGTPDPFSAIGGGTENKIGGQLFGGEGEFQVAVDSSDSPFKDDLYVATNTGEVTIFAADGEQLGALTGLGEACGVAVDQSNGNVYVGSYSNTITRFSPISSTAPVSNASYVEEGGITAPVELCNVDASAEGHVYAWPYYGGSVKQYSAAAVSSEFGTASGKTIGSGVNAQSDPASGDLFVDEGGEIDRLGSDGTEVEHFGGGALTGSLGIGVNGSAERVYATDGGTSVVEFDSAAPPYAPIDNPAVLHAVNDSGAHHWSDFQVTPSGAYAAFSTTLELDEGYENLGHSEVYRYAAGGGELNCVSCPPTNALATGDASLAKNGLSLVDDGRVFFDSQQAIVLRDGDGTKDVYEWEKEGDGPNPGSCEPENPNFFPTGVCLSLISSGTSPFDSSLLSATADGQDAFFFTHDSLARGDQNGPVTKIYDARTDGGIFRIPDPAECAASDECHGPGTKESPTPPIRTIAATPGNPKNATCKKPKVKKNGKCVAKKKKKKHHKRHHRSHHHRRAH